MHPTENETNRIQITESVGNEDGKTKSLYLVLTMTGTFFSKVISQKTNLDYSHSSLSLDASLHRMYSFGRLIRWVPIPGGMVHELPDRNVYRLHQNTKCLIYEIRVTEEQYKEAADFMNKMWRKRRRMVYNYPGVVTANFNRYPRIPNAYYCTQFVAVVLQHIGVKYTEKDYREIKIDDFMNSTEFTLVYEGELRNYWNKYGVAEGYVPY